MYWKDCSFLCVLKTGERQPLDEIRESEGQGTVEVGITLYFAGDGGKVKEG